MLSRPLARHSSLPVAGAYAITNSVPLVISSSRPPARTTIGVAQLTCTLRATRQTSRPVFLSRATMKDFSPLSSSHWKMTTSLYSTGDVPTPTPTVAIPPRAAFHFWLPAKSYAKTSPSEPK